MRVSIICHRGFWRKPEQQNTPAAFKAAFDMGCGIETDVRDLGGELVISHNPPARGCPTLGAVLRLYRACRSRATLALNVKADGLQGMLKKAMASVAPSRFFFFDMSIPDTLGYAAVKLPVFVRQSELEPEPILYARAAGVWLDCFYRDWITARVVEGHLRRGKDVCVVSPEIHSRDPLPLWRRLKGCRAVGRGRLMLCTDLPIEAGRYFA